MQMEQTVSFETSAIRTQTPGNYPKRNKLHLEHSKTLKTRTIKETKQQLTEKDEGTERFKHKWYDEECKFPIEETKKAREKWLIKGRMKKEEQEYHHKRKGAHKIISNKKETHIKNVTQSIEEYQKHNNTGKM